MSRSKFRLDVHDLQEVWRVDDDWTQSTTKEERKKRQNRLNQRVFRKRHAQTESSSAKKPPFRVARFRVSEVPGPVLANRETEKTKSPTLGFLNESESSRLATHDTALNALELPVAPASDPILIYPSSTSLDNQPPKNLASESCAPSDPFDCQASYGVDLNTCVQYSSTTADRTPMPFDALFPYTEKISLAPPAFSSTGVDDIHSHETLDEPPLSRSWAALLPQTECGRANSSPNYFPLSSDHLIHLIQQNVYRALISNKTLLNATANLFKVDLDIIIPMSMNLCDGLSVIRHKSGELLPRSLEPTAVQTSVAHSSWMNMIPFAKMRDNLIEHEGGFNHVELCYDVFGDMFKNSLTYECLSTGPYRSPPTPEPYAGFADPWEELDDEVTTQRKGFIVWGESWDVESWEVTPGFVRKWPWLLKGCEELITTSNRWRAERHEQPLRYPFSV